jgi:hypothetical protein
MMKTFVMLIYYSEIVYHVREEIINVKIRWEGGGSVVKREPESQTPL